MARWRHGFANRGRCRCKRCCGSGSRWPARWKARIGWESCTATSSRANILFTDFDEPALTDFGIADMSGEFKPATGIFTGSPAFMAPEIISGDAPSPASDVYGLGATLFCALTGRAAFARRSGEQLVAQLVRITKESAPDLREQGIPDDLAVVIEGAMSRDP